MYTLIVLSLLFLLLISFSQKGLNLLIAFLIQSISLHWFLIWSLKDLLLFNIWSPKYHLPVSLCFAYLAELNMVFHKKSVLIRVVAFLPILEKESCANSNQPGGCGIYNYHGLFKYVLFDTLFSDNDMCFSICVIITLSVNQAVCSSLWRLAFQFRQILQAIWRIYYLLSVLYLSLLNIF